MMTAAELRTALLAAVRAHLLHTDPSAAEWVGNVSIHIEQPTREAELGGDASEPTRTHADGAPSAWLLFPAYHGQREAFNGYCGDPTPPSTPCVCTSALSACTKRLPCAGRRLCAPLPRGSARFVDAAVRPCTLVSNSQPAGLCAHLRETPQRPTLSAAPNVMLAAASAPPPPTLMLTVGACSCRVRRCTAQHGGAFAAAVVSRHADHPRRARSAACHSHAALRRLLGRSRPVPGVPAVPRAPRRRVHLSRRGAALPTRLARGRRCVGCTPLGRRSVGRSRVGCGRGRRRRRRVDVAARTRTREAVDPAWPHVRVAPLSLRWADAGARPSRHRKARGRHGCRRERGATPRHRCATTEGH
jgi:hypothetical protein